MGKNTIVKDAIILFAITLISGLCLGFVYNMTKDPIAAAQEKAKQEAYQKVFANAASFQENEEIKAALASYTADGAEVTEVLEAVDASGAVIGHVVAVTAKEGYGGDISITMGIDLTGTITGFEVLSMSETAGLGAKCTNDDFKEEFAKKGVKLNEEDGQVEMNRDFDQISGATITSKAITKALNASLKFVDEVR